MFVWSNVLPGKQCCFSVNFIDIPVKRCVDSKDTRGPKIHNFNTGTNKNTNKNIETRLKTKGFLCQTLLSLQAMRPRQW